MSTPPNPSPQSSDNAPAGSVAGLIVAWLFVGLPLAWGVMQTLIKSMALFH
jgi:hypothetical protein